MRCSLFEARLEQAISRYIAHGSLDEWLRRVRAMDHVRQIHGAIWTPLDQRWFPDPIVYVLTAPARARACARVDLELADRVDRLHWLYLVDVAAGDLRCLNARQAHGCGSGQPRYVSSCSIFETTQSNSPAVRWAPQCSHSPDCAIWSGAPQWLQVGAATGVPLRLAVRIRVQYSL